MKKKKRLPGTEKAAAGNRAAFPETRKKTEDKENKGENRRKDAMCPESGGAQDGVSV